MTQSNGKMPEENPVVRAMEKRNKFYDRLPYYITGIVLWWGFCAFIWSIVI